MLSVEKFEDLPSGHGRVGMNWDGTLVIQGSLVRSGEMFLSLEDLTFVNKVVRRWKAKGNKPLPPDRARAA